MIRALVILLILAAPVSASAEIYKYTNPDGTEFFTTQPQKGREPREVYGTPRPRPAASTPRPAPTDRPNPNPNRDQSRFDDLIREAAQTHQIPFEFIKAVIRVESAFDPHAVSHAGAMGLMQLMPKTAESLNCADPFDPRQNIMAGTQYLRMLSNRYNGDINLVLAAYNAGSGTVARYDGIPYEETRRYIERVYQYYQEYLAATAAASAGRPH